MFDPVEVPRRLAAAGAEAVTGQPAADPPVGRAERPMDADELLGALVDIQREMNHLAALQLGYLAEFGQVRQVAAEPAAAGGERPRWGSVGEFATAEVGLALHLTRTAADGLMTVACALEELPSTGRAFRVGTLDLRRVQRTVDGTAGLPPQARAAVEAEVLPHAAEQTVPQLAAAVRRAVLRHAPAVVEERIRGAHDRRAVWVERGEEGSSRFVAEGPTHDVLRLRAAVTALARHLVPSTDALDQRRFDALGHVADAILDEPGLPAAASGRRGLVLLAELGALTRLASARGAKDGGSTTGGSTTGGSTIGGSIADGPAGDRSDGHRPDASSGAGRPIGTGTPVPGSFIELQGDGPIPDSLARRLLADRQADVVAVDRRAPWVCDHTTGYQVPARLARYLAIRYRHCRFPGCRIPVSRCDWDHVTPWPNGPTCACNLVPLCRYHHRLKTHSRWRLRLLPDGSGHWVSPTGRSATTAPDDSDEPRSPAGPSTAAAGDVADGPPAGAGRPPAGEPADSA